MWLLLSLLLTGDIQQFAGGKTLPHEKYIHVVSEADSPVEQVYIKSKDGVYIAAAMRKPRVTGRSRCSCTSTARPAAAAWSSSWAGPAATSGARCSSASCR